MEEQVRVPSVDASAPLTASYTYHSPIPTGKGPYILGVDEAGRGPVLGPMVYGVAYCPASYQDELDTLGFADSKTLNAATRSALLAKLSSDPANLGWSVRVLAPQAISAGMLRHPPVNLNRQSEDATILLIREVLARGIALSAVFVDQLGNPQVWHDRLAALFPGIAFTVTAKADSKFRIVGAASVAAKVTRDAWIDGWRFEEACAHGEEDDDDDGADKVRDETRWGTPMGSGYPSDPKTVAWIKSSLEPTFGFPSLVRFSWTTVKVELEKNGHPVEWIDEGQASLTKAFESATGRDKDRCAVAKELNIKSVGML